MSAAAKFRYTVARCTVHSIAVGMGDHVDIVGDPENAAYEWLIRSPQGVRCHSDVAYGSPDVALRDGLSAYLGEAGAPKPASGRSAGPRGIEPLLPPEDWYDVVEDPRGILIEGSIDPSTLLRLALARIERWAQFIEQTHVIEKCDDTALAITLANLIGPEMRLIENLVKAADRRLTSIRPLGLSEPGADSPAGPWPLRPTRAES